MKLRNKKTGEIVYGSIATYGIGGAEIAVLNTDNTVHGDYEEVGRYKTLDSLNEEWEDYTPKEPLIKNEKIRKAVRAWADACGLSHATYDLPRNRYYDQDTNGKFEIRFTYRPIEVWLENNETYTIDELCGEEE